MTDVTDMEWLRRMRMLKEGWRFCHNRSARKHRRQHHDVHYFGNGEYRWRPRSARTGDAA